MGFLSVAGTMRNTLMMFLLFPGSYYRDSFSNSAYIHFTISFFYRGMLFLVENGNGVVLRTIVSEQVTFGVAIWIATKYSFWSELKSEDVADAGNSDFIASFLF